jgi:Methyltransferase domain
MLHTKKQLVTLNSRSRMVRGGWIITLLLAIFTVTRLMMSSGQGERNDIVAVKEKKKFVCEERHTPPETKQAKTETKSSCEEGVIYRKAGLPSLETRDDIGAFLECRGLQTGAEVGVQYGGNSRVTLGDWPSCTKFYLVDLWKHQDNYHDNANFVDDQQNKIYEAAQNTLKRFKDKTIFLRMSSVEAAPRIPDQSLDFVYIDARHDFCGVTDDMNAYWPKLRPGGIMAGCVSWG